MSATMDELARPDGLVVVSADGRRDEDLARDLVGEERTVLAGYDMPKRRREWLLGRAAGKAAVRALFAAEGRTIEASDVCVLASSTGAPRVTAPVAHGLALTVSHGHGRGAAWAIRGGERGGLPGIDLERVRRRRPETFRFYLVGDERSWVEAKAGASGEHDAEAPPLPRDAAAVLVWSIKEAAFKALQPPRGMGLYDVRVATGGELDAGLAAGGGAARVSYTGKLLEHGLELGLDPARVECRWRREGDLVLAWVLARGCSAPAG